MRCSLVVLKESANVHPPPLFFFLILPSEFQQFSTALQSHKVEACERLVSIGSRAAVDAAPRSYTPSLLKHPLDEGRKNSVL